MKRFLRSPWLWIVVAVLGVLFALQYLAPSGGYDGISAGQMDAYVNAGQVQEITLDGGDQTVKATLKDGVRPEGGCQSTRFSTVPSWQLAQSSALGQIDLVESWAPGWQP